MTRIEHFFLPLQGNVKLDLRCGMKQGAVEEE